MKSCDNCYWNANCYWKMHGEWCLYSSEKPSENTCTKHQYTCEECDSSEVEYSYRGKKYCFDCLLDELEIESYEVTHYTLDGEYIASEENVGDVLLDLNKDIKPIER